MSYYKSWHCYWFEGRQNNRAIIHWTWESFSGDWYSENTLYQSGILYMERCYQVCTSPSGAWHLHKWHMVTWLSGSLIWPLGQVHSCIAETSAMHDSIITKFLTFVNGTRPSDIARHLAKWSPWVCMIWIFLKVLHPKHVICTKTKNLMS